MLQIASNSLTLLEIAQKAANEVKFKRIDRPERISDFDPDEWYNSFPNFNSVYIDSIREKYRVLRHASSRIFPYEVLRAKAPNQSDTEWEYQKRLYKPKTNAVWNRALNKTKVIGNKQNYSIEWPDEKSEQYDYFHKDFPIYSDLVSWVFDILAAEKLNFPNKVCLVYPIVPMREDGTFDQSVPPDPVPVIIEEEDIVHFEYGEKLLYITHFQPGKMHFIGVDKTGYYKFVQDGKNITETLLYSHEWKFLPAFKLRGKAEMRKDGEVLYSSYFADAIPTLDEAIQVNSNLMMSHFKLAFPIIIEVVDDCVSCSGQGQKPDEEGNMATCGTCNGTGARQSLSPTSTYQVRATKGFNETNTLPMNPPVQFAAPSSDILRYGKELLSDLLNSSFDFLFKSERANAATATGEMLELQEFHSFLIEFSNSIFDDIGFLFEAIGDLRFGEGTFSTPTIRRPTEFSFKTNAEITTEIAEARKNNLPESYLSALLSEAAQTRFNTTNVTEEFEFQQRLDKFWYMDSAQLKLNAHVITKADLILHLSFTTILANLQSEVEGDFWELDFPTRSELVNAKVQEIVDSLPADTVDPIEEILRLVE
jgi:hypothetical protein